jgi:hypothetical protein
MDYDEKNKSFFGGTSRPHDPLVGASHLQTFHKSRGARSAPVTPERPLRGRSLNKTGSRARFAGTLPLSARTLS